MTPQSITEELGIPEQEPECVCDGEPISTSPISMVGDKRREALYGECTEGASATRMVHNGRHKLIYYATGNRVQLFDLAEDPRELNDLSDSADHTEIRKDLTNKLIAELYGSDETWVVNGQLVGLPDQPSGSKPNRGLSGQRGSHWPVPPQTGLKGPDLQHN